MRLCASATHIVHVCAWGLACASAAACATTALSPAEAARLAAEHEQLEEALIRDAEDRVLDQHSALEAAFIVSGLGGSAASDDKRRQLVRRLDDIAADLEGVRPDRARALGLLHALHDEILKRYDPAATTLADVAEGGAFNCVSSAVVYAIAAERLDLPVKAVVVPSHVYIVVFTADGPVEVETTAADGFAPDRTSRGYLAFITARELYPNAAVEGAREDLLRRERELAAEVDNLTLLSMMLMNRAADAREGGDTALALRRLQRARALVQQDRKAQVALFEAALVDNLARVAAEQGDFDRALALIDGVQKNAPLRAATVLAHNRAVWCQLKVDALVAAGKQTEAIDFATVQHKRHQHDPRYERLLLQAYRSFEEGTQVEDDLAVESELEQAVEQFPEDERLRRSLAERKARRVGELLGQGRCGPARDLLAELRRLDVEDVDLEDLEDEARYCD